MTTITFTSTDTFMDYDSRAVERHTVEVEEYVEGTYSDLRSGPDGRYIATYEDGAWTICENGRRASDWTVRI